MNLPFQARNWDRTLAQVFEDQAMRSIYDENMAWLNLPPRDFLAYVISRQAFPFEGFLTDPAQYTNNPSFTIAQAHRIWVTLDKLSGILPKSPDTVLVNLGAFPFVIDQAIREYLKCDCRIVSTVNQYLAPEVVQSLEPFHLELKPVNLDPLVKVNVPLEGMTEAIPMPDASVDCILLSHVIEHLYHPFLILKEASRILKPGGKMLITTDNAYMLGAFLNFLTPAQYVHEPVEGTAAMAFHEWRGHVRFFSLGDLETLVKAAGLAAIEGVYAEVLYNSFFPEYFVTPNTKVPGWRAEILREFPVYRNELLLTAVRPI